MATLLVLPAMLTLITRHNKKYLKVEGANRLSRKSQCLAPLYTSVKARHLPRCYRLTPLVIAHIMYL